jgi:hypothetical protein
MSAGKCGFAGNLEYGAKAGGKNKKRKGDTHSLSLAFPAGR